ncbi:MAG: alkaline phosphatase [Rhodospirillaceae bacterium]
MISRRFFMAAGGLTVSVPKAIAQSSRYHFTLGVASGCPRPDGIVLWTRLAPDPLRGGGMPRGKAAVRYRLCSDQAMRRTVREGIAETSEAKAHAVHVVIRGLEPGREYWYQFTFGADESPVGRTKSADIEAASARLALASCAHYEAGQFAAYGDIAAWAPDCVIHVGDYIYETGPGILGLRSADVGGFTAVWENVRQHVGAETVTLWDYRNRYALYKSEPALQAAHAAAPWIAALDDHELDNNWTADIPQDPWAQTPLEFKVRKLAALQAYYEHLPLEQPPRVNGIESHLQLYGTYRFGPAQVHLLDTRQYRSDQVCEAGGNPADRSCDALNDPNLSMTGAAQERWLVKELKDSAAPFNVIASQTWFAPYRYDDGKDAPQVNMDQWDGYPLQRRRLIDVLASGVSNPIVLSGDWHCAAAMRIHKDPWDATSPRIGHNFCGTSISSHCPWSQAMRAARDFNPHVDHYNGDSRGYLRCEVTGRNWRSDYRVLADPRDPRSAVATDVTIDTRDV